MELKLILFYFFLRGLEIILLTGGLVVDDKRNDRCLTSLCVVWTKGKSCDLQEEHF